MRLMIFVLRLPNIPKEIFDSPLCELLKDADILARFLEDPNKPLTGIARQRLIDALADINN